MDMRGKGPRIAFAAACLGLSVSIGVLASAYTTAGMDPFYTQQRDRPTAYQTSYETAASAEVPDSPSYPPIASPR